MIENEIKNIILNYIIEYYKEFNDTDNINYNTSLIYDGYMDSLSMISLVIFIEKKFNIEIKKTEITPSNFDNIEKISILVKNYLDNGSR